MRTKVKLIRPTPEEEIEINRGIALDPDNPEWTAAEFAAARPGHIVEAEHIEREAKRIGRPPKDNPKVMTTVRYDADIVEQFRATGEGWQTRMNDALRTYLEEHSL